MSCTMMQATLSSNLMAYASMTNEIFENNLPQAMNYSTADRHFRLSRKTSPIKARANYNERYQNRLFTENFYFS